MSDRNARLGVHSPDLRSLMPKVYAFMNNFEQSQARLVYDQSRFRFRSTRDPSLVRVDTRDSTVTLLTQRLGALASAYNDVSCLLHASQFPS